MGTSCRAKLFARPTTRGGRDAKEVTRVEPTHVREARAGGRRGCARWRSRGFCPSRYRHRVNDCTVGISSLKHP